ncbi:MAG: putative sialic acid transporter [Verrucomicrobiota bacterium]|jgi:MFS family permease
MNGLPPLTRTQWLICSIAAIGFAFDIYELLMLPLVIKPALAVLGGAGADGAPLLTPGSEAYVKWARTLFFVPALAGGVFGLLGGFLTDLLGRRRVLTYSILLYAGAAVGAGLSTSLGQLLFFRCLVFIGVCVEFVAAVAWLAEIFTQPERREKVLGYTQAASSIGGLLVAGANILAAQWASALPAIHGNHEAWRYTLISGVIPALPLILIRPFLPESPEWEQNRKLGQLRRPSVRELFSPELARTTLVTTLVFAASYGIAFGAIQQLPQILGAPVTGHQQIHAAGAAAKEAAIARAKSEGRPAPSPAMLKQAVGNATDKAVAAVTLWQEIGGLVGRVLLAFLAVLVVSRRKLLRIFQIPALILVPLLFWWISGNLKADSLSWVKVGVFVAGMLTVSQFSFWGNYIPLVFPVHLRGTGESFAANIGGRVLGTAAAWLTLTFSEAKPPDASKIALTGAVVAGLYALVGVLLTQFLPEPSRESDSRES